MNGVLSLAFLLKNHSAKLEVISKFPNSGLLTIHGFLILQHDLIAFVTAVIASFKAEQHL